MATTMEAPVVNTVAALAGSALAGLFGFVAAARRGRPLHPRGVVVTARVRRHGSAQPWGARWLDERGEDHGRVRLSKAAGLPGPFPDVGGLALTFEDEDGRHDLLLATTGARVAARHMLAPRRRLWAAFYGSLLPYRCAGGLVLVGADPQPDSAGRDAFSFRLLAACPIGPWRPFGVLDLSWQPGELHDEPLRFDPVRRPPAGLRWPRPLAALREPAYTTSRRLSGPPS